MGFTYLEGKRWSQVTRDERFFCQRLYQRIESENAACFIAFLRDVHGLDVPIEGEWEVGFEVCFYRDLWQLRGREGVLFSPKRTFDLCLFGEEAIVIIEAKAAERFDRDQNELFVRDIGEVSRQTKVDNVKLVGLCSSKYEVEPERAADFTGPILRWGDLARRYDDDEILLGADSSFDGRTAFSDFGRNAEVKLTGGALMDAFQGGAWWWVGRGGGLRGEAFKEDIRSGRWLTQRYEVNTSADERPSPNYFELYKFAAAVRIEASRPGEL